MRPAVYFNPTTNEIFTVGLSQDEQFPAGNGWIKVSDNPRLGLLPVRELLVQQGLVENARRVYWYGFRGSADGRENDRAFSQSWQRADVAASRQQRLSFSVLSRVRDLLRTLFGVRSRHA